ncbi:GNAT family N-acetyltransferase [Actinoplanes sp. CA-252034]|uniref:GNAT family N-acetyltransferase n=1 Tax=Actinoplanes sp. CA-252034 TaxID=3239906 RepID=UPI003D978C52
MAEIQRLRDDHAEALLAFEVTNREFFARTIPDRGDDYFTDFSRRHTALLAEQSTGTCQFHVLVDEDGAVLGRFNLFDVAEGSAELGYRVAEHATGRGLAKLGVRRVIDLARHDYGLTRLTAGAGRDNTASLAVLRATGFVAVGPSERGGIRHVRDLGAP